MNFVSVVLCCCVMLLTLLHSSRGMNPSYVKCCARPPGCRPRKCFLLKTLFSSSSDSHKGLLPVGKRIREEIAPNSEEQDEETGKDWPALCDLIPGNPRCHE
ncbi:unnamed protein product [Clavelina lepadiformis]|uniref:Uncharacterized protein n=1 Tax=Clavelina lepadiformis TaxID=159417 RepID=A0ABP0F0T4_CLALP